VESFFRSEFKKLTNGGRLLRLDMLLDWQEIADLVSEGVVSQQQVTRIFEGLPREPMGIPSTVLGITEDSFVYFNNMLDVLLDAKGPQQPAGAVASRSAATPLQLISEPARPMPAKDRELTIGSLGSPTLGENTTSCYFTLS